MLATETRSARPAHLEPGSPLAHTLYSVLSGGPITIVKSPPGAGKTTLIVELVTYLLDSLGQDCDVRVATFTNNQGTDVAARLARSLGADSQGRPRVEASSSKIGLSPNVGAAGHDLAESSVRVSTIAALGMSQSPCDILIIDEAYQITHNDFVTAADGAAQVVLVGDSGQIGPVVTFRTETWRTMAAAPQVPCPVALEGRADVTVVHLPSTYRLGPASAHVIGGLYDFPFASRRPERHLVGHEGEARILQVPVTSTEFDLEVMSTVVDAAQAYIGSELVEPGATRTLAATDVAIVASRTAQISAIESILAARGVEGVSVGTADRLQGGQWHAVVAIDPLLAGRFTEHAASSGRLCVMASRHMTHLTWVHDGQWAAALEQVADAEEAGRGAEMRARLFATATAS